MFRTKEGPPQFVARDKIREGVGDSPVEPSKDLFFSPNNLNQQPTQSASALKEQSDVVSFTPVRKVKGGKLIAALTAGVVALAACAPSPKDEGNSSTSSYSTTVDDQCNEAKAVLVAGLAPVVEKDIADINGNQLVTNREKRDFFINRIRDEKRREEARVVSHVVSAALLESMYLSDARMTQEVLEESARNTLETNSKKTVKEVLGAGPEKTVYDAFKKNVQDDLIANAEAQGWKNLIYNRVFPRIATIERDDGSTIILDPQECDFKADELLSSKRALSYKGDTLLNAYVDAKWDTRLKP